MALEYPEEFVSQGQLDFPIVGIGASAGGLDAISTMFRNIDTRTGMTFVLVMHLGPDLKCLLAERLGHKTRIQVRQISDHEQINVDCLYVIPPGSSLRIEGNKFRLEPISQPNCLRRLIDNFFASLAHAQGEKAVCVVLSGTGADGISGLRVVKELGGICVAQSPQEALYDTMPVSAISTKLTDFILQADEIIPGIIAHFAEANRATGSAEGDVERILQRMTKMIGTKDYPVHQNQRITFLEEELQAKSQLLRNKFREIETANAALKSSNDDLMSVNQELQSANEALQNKIDALTLAYTELGEDLPGIDPEDGCAKHQTSGCAAETPDGFSEWTIVDTLDKHKQHHNLSLNAQSLRLALEAGKMGFAEYNVDNSAVSIDALMAQLMELDGPGEYTLEDFQRNVLPEDIFRAEKRMKVAIEEQREDDFEFRVQAANGGIKWLRTRALPYISADGCKKLVGPAFDITNSKMAEDHQQMLLSEMNHRIKNLFAVISGILQTIPKQSHEVEIFAAKLNSRVVALGRSYEIARKSALQQGVELGELIQSTLEPHQQNQTVSVQGPPQPISDDSLTSFTLVLHELVTNAVKYGALSTTQGKINISWKVKENGETAIEWHETGIALRDKPIENGFGSRLIDASMDQLKGSWSRKINAKSVDIKLSLTLGAEK